jgi:hypothetical protein
VELASSLVGGTLIAGLVLFLVGAAAWRLEYEQPLPDALRIIDGDRRRRAWIHLWMIPALFVTGAGLIGLVVLIGLLEGPTAAVLGAMAAAVYVMGAVCWIASLAFRLTVVPWAAEETTVTGRIPEAFPALDAWAGSLYVIHMAASYVAFVLLGAAILSGAGFPAWLGWLGIGWGVVFAAGFVATRASGPFNPPLWAHTYTAVVGVVLLMA